MHISTREVRKNISKLIDKAEHGEEIVILRHGKPVARLSSVSAAPAFTSRKAFRQTLPAAKIPSSQLVRINRDEERY
jgi:prevent-host-death family protein